MSARFLLLVSALLVDPALTFAQTPACPQFFAGGQPPALLNPKLGQRATLLCNDAFAVLASGVTRGGLWSAEHPTAASLDAARETPREGQFHADDRLPPGDQARLEDFRRSGFDRGHMTPSGDMPDTQSQQQTFSLANMVPQTPELNRGVWAGIEMAVRHLAQRHGELFVVTGPAFQGQALKTIGLDGVLVPSATWKAVYDPRSGGAGAYVCSNAAAPQCGTMSIAMLASTPVPGAAGQREADGDDPAAPRGEPLCSRASTSPGGPMTMLKPFADDAASILIGELTIEKGTDRIALYGLLDLARDKQGLAHARALAALLDQAIQFLEADKSLLDAVPPPVASKTVKNPFG